MFFNKITVGIREEIVAFKGLLVSSIFVVFLAF